VTPVTTARKKQSSRYFNMKLLRKRYLEVCVITKVTIKN